MEPASLLYLYAVLPQGTPAERILDGGGLGGVDPAANLFALRAAGLSAAVSEVSGEQFGEGPLNTLLQDLSRVGPYALRHNEAIRSLSMHTPALIPLAFGSVHVSPAGIVNLLETHAEEFQGLLDYLHGKQEWTLKVYADMQRLATVAEEGSADVRKLAEEAANTTPGRAYLVRRRRSQAVEKEVVRRRTEVLQEVLESLGQTSAATRLDDLPHQEPASRVLALRAALLVEMDRVGELQSRSMALQEKYGASGFQLDISGPWPAYSFVGTKR